MDIIKMDKTYSSTLLCHQLHVYIFLLISNIFTNVYPAGKCSVGGEGIDTTCG